MTETALRGTSRGIPRAQTNKVPGEGKDHETAIDFYKPLAIGAPAPLRELPVRPERMIHFFPPHIEKIRARAPELAKTGRCHVRQPRGRHSRRAKDAARRGFIELGRSADFGDTALWMRVNALNSPWFLDDVMEIVAAVGDKLDVVMIPKVEGPWDIHYVDQLLAQLEARHELKKPILHPRHAGDRPGREQRRGHRRRQSAHARA